VLALKATDKLDSVSSLSHSVLNRRLRFVSANESYEHMFAYSCTQLKGLALLEVVHASDVPHLSKVTKLLLKGTIASCEVIEWRATGTGRFVLTRDTLWGIGSSGVRGPDFISMVSEKVVEQTKSATFVKDTKSVNLVAAKSSNDSQPVTRLTSCRR
jgi:PAS domain-containing protein